MREKNFLIHYGDLNDQSSLTKLIYKIKPNEIYNLAAQSHVQVSFDNPVYTAETNAIGTLKLLEACKSINKNIKFIRHHHLRCLVKILKFHKKRVLFYPSSPYALPRYLLTGYLLIIEIL